MTINVTSPRETQSLIRPLQRTFYPVKIPEQHHQLRHFISTTYQNRIYYASDHKIYALHLSDRKRELITSLNWTPQCLDAGHGWICVGGSEGGRFAYIDIGDDNSERDRALQYALQHHDEVDALLPLDLEPSTRLFAHSLLEQSQSRISAASRRKPKVHTHDFGGEIVNSVTIHRSRIGGKEEVIAVLTNNDETIRIFSLTKSRLYETLEFSIPMNYATISPDGELMIAVGDKPQAFFCRRSLQPCLPMQNSWRIIAEPKLSMAHSADACFSTAFSPSGHICAVASQTGVITIFDTSMIREDMESDEAVLFVLRSSRPCLGRDLSGAVRSMSFGPAPWDLFAWAEDKGRVCVVDLRDALRSRQTIELEIDCPSLDRASMSDFEDNHIASEQRQLEIEASYIRRHREAFDTADFVSTGADYIEFMARRQSEARDDESSSPRDEDNSLTEGERHMLDAVRMSHIQGNDQGRTDDTPQPPFSINYNQTRTDRSVEPTQSEPRNNRGTASIHEYMRQRNLERNRAAERSYQPRRRSSVVISNGNSTTNSNSSHPSSLAPVGTATPTLSASPSRLPSTTEATVTPSISLSRDPWITVVDVMGPGGPVSQRREPIQRSLERRATHTARLRTESHLLRLRQLQGMTTERTRSGESHYDEQEEIVRRMQEARGRRYESLGTMGIGWSSDGRQLYVGTEEGILEYTVNTSERKTFPGMAMQ